MFRHTLAATALVLTLASGAILAAPADAQQKLLARRAAALDAYRKLAERILGLQISADTTVRDYCTESDRIGAYLDHFIKGVRFTATREFDDGSVEVDAELTILQIITTLKKSVDEVYEGGKWKKEHFEEITKRTQRKVISVTGSGVVRPGTKVPDPKGVAVVAPLVGGKGKALHLPAIFRKHPPAERLKAKRAAELDAYRKLMERIYGLNITSTTTVKDFVTESDVVRTHLEGQLKGARTTSVVYAEDGVVEVKMEVTLKQVITNVQKTYDEVYKGGKWTRKTFEDIQKHTRRKVICVVGVGAMSGAKTSGAAQDDDVIELN